MRDFLSTLFTLHAVFRLFIFATVCFVRSFFYTVLKRLILRAIFLTIYFRNVLFCGRFFDFDYLINEDYSLLNSDYLLFNGN